MQAASARRRVRFAGKSFCRIGIAAKGMKYDALMAYWDDVLPGVMKPQHGLELLGIFRPGQLVEGLRIVLLVQREQPRDEVLEGARRQRAVDILYAAAPGAQARLPDLARPLAPLWRQAPAADRRPRLSAASGVGRIGACEIRPLAPCGRGLFTLGELPGSGRRPARGQAPASLEKDYAIVVCFVALLIVLSLTANNFLTWINLLNTLESGVIYGIVAIALTVLLIVGEFDLCAGAIYVLAGIVAAKLQPLLGTGPSLAIGVATGLAVGAFNGIVVAFVRINSFIATLASGLMVVGIGTEITNGFQLYVADPGFGALGNAKALGIDYFVWIFSPLPLPPALSFPARNSAGGSTLPATTPRRHTYPGLTPAPSAWVRSRSAASPLASLARS